MDRLGLMTRPTSHVGYSETLAQSASEEDTLGAGHLSPAVMGVRSPRSHVRSGVVYLAGSAVERGARVAALALVAKGAPPETAGMWTLLMAMLTYALFLPLGLLNGLKRDLPISIVVSPKSVPKNLTSALAGSIGATGIGVCLAIPLIDSLGLTWRTQALLVGAAMVQAAYAWTISALQGTGRFGLLGVQQAIVGCVMMSTLWLAVPRWGLDGAVAGFGLSLAVGAVLGAWAFRKQLSTTHFQATAVARLTRTGMWMLTAGVLYAVLTTMDRWLLRRLGSESELGYYSLAVTALGVCSLWRSTISEQLYPRMLRAYAETRSALHIFNLAVRQSGITGILTVPIAVAISTAAHYLVPRFVPMYSAGLAALDSAMVSAVALSFSAGFGNYFNARGGRHAAIYATWIAASCMQLLISAAIVGSRTPLTAIVMARILMTVALVYSAGLAVLALNNRCKAA